MTGKVFQFSLKKMDLPKSNFALQLKANIQIDKEGDFTFYITSNDGSKLYVNNGLLIDNDGEHGAKELSNSIHLTKGMHPIVAEYFQTGGSKVLSVSYSAEEISYQPIPEYLLFK